MAAAVHQGEKRIPKNPVLVVEDLSKIYPGTVANDAVSLEFFAGEVHAVLGENGAGKSTLVKMLFGLESPDGGRLYWGGRPVSVSSPAVARKLGIRMVPQHMSLVTSYSVLENILLQVPVLGRNSVTRDSLRSRILELGEEFGLPVDPDAIVADLPMGTRQIVDIFKALVEDCRLLILDEPTAVLTPGEVDRLFSFLGALRDQGCALVLIAHKIEEILRIGDRISILRDGRKVDTLLRAEAEPGRLARLMVGREIKKTEDRREAAPAGAREVCRLAHVTESAERRDALKDISMELRAGEIFGVAGIDGNGQRSIFDIIAGRKRDYSGDCLILGKDPRETRRSEYLRLPLGLVPEDRHAEGLVLSMTVAENAILQFSGNPPFSRFGWWLRPAEWRMFARDVISRYRIKTEGPAQPVGRLSGGNQQKVLLAREISRRPDFLVLSNPTRGLDIGATEFIHQLILAERARGCAILLISGDLTEIVQLSDRIGVLHNGRFMSVRPRSCIDMDTVGLEMAGEVAS